MEKLAFTPRVFSGIKPSGGLTLGNYLGAIKRFVDMQGGEFETIYCVVDMHAITVWQDPEDLRHATREVAAGYLAAGIDPEKSVLFNQSRVSAHAELGWLLNCVARVGWMNRMTQFKDKAGKNAENVSLGLYAYPSLMAADILLYHATHVPVGEDQKQHVELTRDIAHKFNHDYKVDFFPETIPVIEGPAMRVMNLRDGTKKMSKSGESDMERVNMTDDADTIAKKFKKAKSDADVLPEEMEGLANRPDARNLVNIYAGLANMTGEEVLAVYGGQGWGKFKPDLAELAVEKLAPISSEMKRLMNDPAEIDRIMAKGADKANEIAQPILNKTFEIMGFVR
ncbi:MAG: tryptophan--tRNA ligase [Alphaproteobacteria bacterium]|jgi:tryptophanyl-tRNA synthetase|uniref:Tryptophan--tRNA ligase n=1 Tax=Celeribacter baekdonensis TaxID=875171 RepID=A0A1G7JCN8_9RHOB|nr:tryptophan--tRNA ligase [Celeribacter baekdonensis]MBU0643791.1 tryptophan--tRNA ligase [Alphaproteobacteria bacterium]MBU1278598.1 tryptophan--tRNA ligase [Alphaproteobacteria bacterium]MBU1573154.1 tryptophan--tRNA ligase [Alphaproteobacteria bacterium]MBU1830365.1 tryptophan--tRNA ligase [Alphaproteobacteria bacterium]MBU2078214.1 tryptophan--tRNA ligase [Alphaproteobacteria bacterium]